MDIDEFLDRELSDLGVSPKDEKTPQENFDSSPLFETIRDHIGRGNIDDAENSFNQLWHQLTEQKLKWNRELYEQLSLLSRQFFSALSQAYNDTKTKASQIYDMINKGRAAIKEGKKEVPFKLYTQMQEINNSIPNAFFEEKRVVQEQILSYYRDLNNATDAELVRRIASLVQETYRLIDKINTAIKSNDMVNALLNYNKCIELYNQIPEGFLRHKNSVGLRLLEIYKSLSIYNEISALQRQLLQQPEKPAERPQARDQIREKLSSFEAASIGDDDRKAAINEMKTNARKLMEQGLYKEALREVQKILKISPKDAEAISLDAKIKTMA